jgi:hypothetical protein
MQKVYVEKDTLKVFIRSKHAVAYFLCYIYQPIPTSRFQLSEFLDTLNSSLMCYHMLNLRRYCNVYMSRVCLFLVFFLQMI